MSYCNGEFGGAGLSGHADGCADGGVAGPDGGYNGDDSGFGVVPRSEGVAEVR